MPAMGPNVGRPAAPAAGPRADMPLPGMGLPRMPQAQPAMPMPGMPAGRPAFVPRPAAPVGRPAAPAWAPMPVPAPEGGEGEGPAPSITFIKRAKAAGVKFSLGTNNGSNNDLGRLEYCLKAINEAGLTGADMFIPRPANEKKVIKSGLPSKITG